jgi:hypothetical protein
MKRFTQLFLFGLILLAACTAVPTLAETDEVAIYTAVIEQLYTQDDTFGGTFNAPDLYILTETDDSVGDPEIEQSDSKTIGQTVQTKITDALSHLPTNIVWVVAETAVPTDSTTGTVANNGAILTLGNIHGQRNGTVLVSGSIYISALAAGGQTYILEKVNGIWQISGTSGARWVS